MSLCQNNKNGSCGACCGIYNLEFSKSEINSILNTRTDFFNKNVSFELPDTIIGYREKFELLESNFPKKDYQIYNCPFLGFIDIENKKIGCMIHPSKSKNPLSQNFSFYGASICQTYDCKNKENHVWLKEILSDLELDYFEYSKIASNHIFISKLDLFFKSIEINLEIDFKKYKIILCKIFEFYLAIEKISNLTSFEIEMESKEKINNENEIFDYFSKFIEENELIELKKIFLSL